jgi:Tfp pilus assembly protein PilP
MTLKKFGQYIHKNMGKVNQTGDLHLKMNSRTSNEKFR